MNPVPGKVTVLLQRVSEGDRDAHAELMPLVYRELRALAGSHLRRERSNHTLQPTALVNEVYLKLVELSSINWRNQAHFFGVSSQLMRQILVDVARRRLAAKRGAGRRTTLDPASLSAPSADAFDLVLFVDSVLHRLAALDQRQARIVEMKFFAQMEIEQIAEVLDVSPSTVKREWNSARAWLQREFENGGGAFS
jgi:RNA polymerase sigma factor (TIGR02999 family)